MGNIVIFHSARVFIVWESAFHLYGYVYWVASNMYFLMSGYLF